MISDYTYHDRKKKNKLSVLHFPWWNLEKVVWWCIALKIKPHQISFKPQQIPTLSRNYWRTSDKSSENSFRMHAEPEWKYFSTNRALDQTAISEQYNEPFIFRRCIIFNLWICKTAKARGETTTQGANCIVISQEPHYLATSSNQQFLNDFLRYILSLDSSILD